ncbi:FtsW/RodA/SpoVE family cell cycle protein [Suilimivivens aceti]|uniref:FtsW/RodA/SpoVE family cell cycle protein n=1 Tax=Suilimivivens aceti TaxID=2981774 RepID=A0ABT2SZI4_9FIRM|nr:FtsW/RodA/SpoVE family cell cycle protein [Suilimivivens aceti]MCU6743408.1 FtsW/RodA/SpoVE family cell cycle protein [Suilimivivens aceti]RHV52323.1 FtsW/RodA/SpoVE family cell cycle protein [Lachnospiraceae bacterium OM04-12BH]SCH17914.1 Cell division protein FtsW [uncultured Clostridium sp.]
MELYVSEFSKYVITLLIALYTYESFAVFRKKQESDRNGIYTRQNILMFGLHFSCFIVICFETGDITYLFFYAFQQIVLYATVILFRMLYPKTNRLLVNNMCMLLTVGFVILTRLSLGKAIRQFIIVMISLVIALVIPFFVSRFRFLKEWKWIYAAAGIVALGIVLVLGQTTYGSKLSYTIAGLTFQPSEFVKIIFVFFVASALYKAAGFFEVFTTAVIAAAHVIILVCSKDLGSALIFFVVYVLMVVVASRNWLYLLAGVSGGSVAAYLAYRVFPHIQVRVQAFKDPWSVIDSTGYQITQSLFAITSGGWFGLGLFKGTPESIPFVEADFIFSAITEELGLLFALCVILICVSSFVMFMNISMNLKDKFYQLTAFGLGVTYIFQVFLTIGGGCKFIPLTGVTLPFISYGGSSVLTTLIMFSITEGLSMIQEEEAEEEKHRRKRIRQKKKKQAGRKKDRPVYEYEDLDFEEDGETFEQEEE